MNCVPCSPPLLYQVLQQLQEDVPAHAPLAAGVLREEGDHVQLPVDLGHIAGRLPVLVLHLRLSARLEQQLRRLFPAIACMRGDGTLSVHGHLLQGHCSLGDN